MKKLLEKDDSEDDFWNENRYFGKKEEIEEVEKPEDEESFIATSSGKDEFDTDFMETSSDNEDDEDEENDGKKKKKKKIG